MAGSLNLTATTSTNFTSVAATSITCDIPADVRPGALGIWMICGQNATVPSSNPTGWSTWTTGTTTGLNQAVYIKSMDGTETTTQTSGTLSSARQSTQMMFLQGWRTNSEVVGSSMVGTTATTFNSVTPTTPGGWVVALCSMSFASGVTPGTTSSSNLTNIRSITGNIAAAINVMCNFGTAEWSSGAFTPNMSNSAATTRYITNRLYVTATNTNSIVVMAPPTGA